MSPLFSSTDLFSSNQPPDVEAFCGRWIAKHKPLVSGLGPAPGTTFPPFSTKLPYLKQRMSRSVVLDKPEAKWKSEPDLNSDYNCNSLEEDISGHNEEPHDEELFEFDIGSPASSEGNESIEYDSKPIINIIEEEEEDEVKRSFSISSDSSSCSHRKESGVVVDGFSSIFGSTNSSLTDRRSILRQFEDSRGISVNPEDWKENGSLYLGGNLAAFSQKKSLEGSTSPILADSPQVETDCPYISPDSVIGDDSLFSDQDLCFQCATSHVTADTAEEEPQTKKAVDEILEDEKDTLTVPVQPRTDDIMQRLSDRINANNKTVLPVSSEKLTNLLDKLGPIKEDSDYNEEEDISPLRLLHQNSLDVRPRPKLRKCSSLKSSSSPPRTSSQRKIVRLDQTPEFVSKIQYLFLGLLTFLAWTCLK